MGNYDSIGIPISGQPISSGNYGVKVRDAIIDLDARVSVIASNLQDKTKLANEPRTSTTTLTLDSELQGVPLDVGTWEITARLAMVGNATAAMALKTQWSFSGTWTNVARLVEGPTAGNTTAGNGNISFQRTKYNTNADAVYGNGIFASPDIHMTEYCKQIVVTVAGNFGILWAPNTSSANAVGLRIGSTITARQVA